MTDELRDDELESQRGDLLPEREAMSLVPTDVFGGPVPAEVGTAATAGDATAAEGDALVADAAARESGEPSTTSEPRSESYSASDTATAQS